MTHEGMTVLAVFLLYTAGTILASAGLSLFLTRIFYFREPREEAYRGRHYKNDSGDLSFDDPTNENDETVIIRQPYDPIANMRRSLVTKRLMMIVREKSPV